MSDRDEAEAGTGDPLPSWYDVARVMEHKANATGRCGVCSGEITTTISLPHDRECLHCSTKYQVVGRQDDGQPEYDLVWRTTPFQRIRRLLRQSAYTKVVFEELAGDATEADPDATDATGESE